MSKPIARYSVMFGLQGGYLPDSHNGPYIATTRRELASIIRNELEMYDLPANLFRDVRISRIWSYIRKNGSSTAHFCLYHGNNVLEFNGLTEDEANQMEKENDR